MHSFVISKNVKWCHLIWPTLYINLRFTYLLTNDYVQMYAEITMAQDEAVQHNSFISACSHNI